MAFLSLTRVFQERATEDMNSTPLKYPRATPDFGRTAQGCYSLYVTFALDLKRNIAVYGT